MGGGLSAESEDLLRLATFHSKWNAWEANTSYALMSHFLSNTYILPQDIAAKCHRVFCLRPWTTHVPLPQLWPLLICCWNDPSAVMWAPQCHSHRHRVCTETKRSNSMGSWCYHKFCNNRGEWGVWYLSLQSWLESETGDIFSGHMSALVWRR